MLKKKISFNLLLFTIIIISITKVGFTNTNEFINELENDLKSAFNSEATSDEKVIVEFIEDDEQTMSFVESFKILFNNPLFRSIFIFSIIIGLIISYFGIFIVLNKSIFFGFTLSQAAAAGVALGLLNGYSPEDRKSVV